MNGKDEEWVMIFGRKNRLQSYKNVFTMNKILKKNGRIFVRFFMVRRLGVKTCTAVHSSRR